MRPLRPVAKRHLREPTSAPPWAMGSSEARSRTRQSALRHPASRLKTPRAESPFGGYAGYNWQRCCSPFVFGVETDINFLNTSPTGFDIEPAPETVSLKSKMDWFGTLRGRAGIVVHDSWLLYGTAGLAYGGGRS